jgi:predicted AlkP superfamily pyrophosphatase or phosphodiesterase
MTEKRSFGMSPFGKKVLIIQAAALSHEAARGLDIGLDFQAGQSVFPAVTCTVQASFRTAALPAAHGMIANGRYDRTLRRVSLWEQSSALVAGHSLWREFRRAGGTVAQLFCQQSLGGESDILLSPAPIHKSHGGMIEDCYCRPEGLYRKLCSSIGRPFRLHQYWGPLASAKVGDWIAAATAEILADPTLAPGVCVTYLPSLDYDFQRYGPHHARSRRALETLQGQLRALLAAAQKSGYETVIFGDYAIVDCSGAAVLPNRILHEHGLMKARNVKGRLYADFHASRALALVDHEVAHIHVAAPPDIAPVREILLAADGVERVLDAAAQAELGMRHANGGELVAVARSGRWFAYPWWTDIRNAPDYAGHVDIHNKPGFDPCELFFSWCPPGVCRDTSRIRGTHGRVGEGREIAIASTIPALAGSGGIVDLARGVRRYLESA